MIEEHKIAKQLKEAGFPQETSGNGAQHIFPGYIIPTLSDLIKECGEEFSSLTMINKDDAFYSNKFNGSYYIAVGWKDRDVKNKLISVYAKIPSEAVAKLWLKLNDRN